MNEKPIIHLIHGQLQNSAIYDYCDQLSMAFNRAGVETRLFMEGVASRRLFVFARQLFRFIRRIDSNNDIVNFHYPGWPFLLQILFIPQLIFLLLRKQKTIVTVHDYLKFHPWIRTVYLPYFFLADSLVFTTPEEKNAVAQLMIRFDPSFEDKCTVIPVASNIDLYQELPPLSQRSGLAYFGHLRRGKGLKSVLDVAQQLHTRKISMPVSIIGNVENFDFHRFRFATSLVARVYRLPKHFKKQLANSENSTEFSRILSSLPDEMKRLPNVTFHISKTHKECSTLLAQCRYGLLPFVDGASERRGSLQAMLKHQCVTFTTWSDHTPDYLKDITIGVSSPYDVIAQIEKYADHTELQAAAKAYADNNNWDRASEAYLEHAEVTKNISFMPESR